jgi:hypothetical protein
MDKYILVLETGNNKIPEYYIVNSIDEGYSLLCELEDQCKEEGISWSSKLLPAHEFEH